MLQPRPVQKFRAIVNRLQRTGSNGTIAPDSVPHSQAALR